VSKNNERQILKQTIQSIQIQRKREHDPIREPEKATIKDKKLIWERCNSHRDAQC
jgi:hypothetical protein